MQQNSARIDEYLNTFMLMNIVNQEKKEQWTYRCLRQYYKHHYNEFHKSCMYEELRMPNIRCIEAVNDQIKKKGLFFDQRKFRTKNCLRVGNEGYSE